MLLNDLFFELYLPHKPATSARTITLYKGSLKKFGQWLGHRPGIDDFDDTKLGSYLSACFQSGSSAATCNKERNHLLALWRFANRKGLVDIGPTVQPLKEPVKVPTALTVGQLRQLHLAFDTLQGRTAGIRNSDFLRACFSIQYTTAARIGAVLQLEFSDVRGDVITFRAETRKGGRRPIVKAVPEFVLDHLERISKPKRDRIFPIKKTNQTKIQLLYKRLFERAGVPRPKGKSSHLLRSTHATLLELAGGDATKSLGHASRETTIKSYLDPRHDADRSCDMLPEIE